MNNTNGPTESGQQSAVNQPEINYQPLAVPPPENPQILQQPTAVSPEVLQGFQQPIAAPPEVHQTPQQPVQPVVNPAQGYQSPQQPVGMPDATYQSFQQPQQQYQQTASFTHAPPPKKGISPWGIAGIAAGILLFLLACAVVCGIVFLNATSDENIFGSDRIETFDEFLLDTDAFSSSPDPEVMAQISSEFFDADVDIADPGREAVSPTVYRGDTESVFTDEFFNISITVPHDTSQQNIHERSDSYSWGGFSRTGDYSVHVRRTGSPGATSWWGSTQEEIKMMATWSDSTIVESGVLTINGEEYVYIRHYSNDWPDTHQLEIGRSINGVLLTIEFHIFGDTSRSTASFLE